MAEYNKVNVKLSDPQVNKLKYVVRNQTKLILRMNIKMFDGDLASRSFINSKTKY